MLNKDACRICTTKAYGAWTEDDEGEWEKGVIHCMILIRAYMNFDRPLTLATRGNPPSGCPYVVEHVLT